MKRTHGRQGEAQEFIEFETKDGYKFLTQRSGAHFPVYKNIHGALEVMYGPVSLCLQDGEADARKLAEQHEASLTLPPFGSVVMPNCGPSLRKSAPIP